MKEPAMQRLEKKDFRQREQLCPRVRIRFLWLHYSQQVNVAEGREYRVKMRLELRLDLEYLEPKS